MHFDRAWRHTVPDGLGVLFRFVDLTPKLFDLNLTRRRHLPIRWRRRWRQIDLTWFIIVVGHIIVQTLTWGPRVRHGFRW